VRAARAEENTLGITATNTVPFKGGLVGSKKGNFEDGEVLLMLVTGITNLSTNNFAGRRIAIVVLQTVGPSLEYLRHTLPRCVAGVRGWMRGSKVGGEGLVVLRCRYRQAGLHLRRRAKSK